MNLPDTLCSLINTSLVTLAKKLTVSNLTTISHDVSAVTGWHDRVAIEALAIYLVALRACVVNQAGDICLDLIGGKIDFASDILRSVEEIVTQPVHSKEKEKDWKATWRNPWIAEGIWHCLMRLAMEDLRFHPVGAIIALDFSHVSPKDHGLDVTVLYLKADGNMGMSLVETKAYKNDPNGAIADAVSMLKEIENGRHDTRIRQMVVSFQAVIDEKYRPKLTLSLWKKERRLIPNPHYEARGATVDWSRKRPVFSGLSAPVLVMPHAINGYDAFFDTISQEMQSQALRLVADV